jgi:fatty acid desaturase
MSGPSPSRQRFQPAGEIGPDTFPPETLSPKTRGRYGRSNTVVLAAQTVGWAALLFGVDRAPGWPAKIALVAVFCALMQGVFSMMHEYFHDNAHPDPRINYAIGFWGSILFGTAATFHRVHHWGHHVRNRSVSEQADFIHDGESPIGKVVLYYFAICGGLFLSGLVFPLIALLIPYRTANWISRFRRFNTYSAAFQQFKPGDWTRIRIEAVALVAFWTALVAYAPVRWQTLAVCYAAFAFTWSSLQWIYHLRTPLHVVEGAYNLRLPTARRWLFLNFNCNLTHHRRPYLPWQDLYAATDRKETQPLWYRWLLMLHWPVRFPDDLGGLDKRYF